VTFFHYDFTKIIQMTNLIHKNECFLDFEENPIVENEVSGFQSQKIVMASFMASLRVDVS